MPAKNRTLEELANALNQVEKESVFPTTQLDLYGKLLDEVQFAAPAEEANKPLFLAYEALEEYARKRIKDLLIDFASYYGIRL